MGVIKRRLRVPGVLERIKGDLNPQIVFIGLPNLTESEFLKRVNIHSKERLVGKIRHEWIDIRTLDLKELGKSVDSLLQDLKKRR